ncbi:MAG: OsmC family protein [Candidatus Accumulibacter sp.]|uniref:OsmC family protein n=1 Tax=Accumulibacter sp. TaxID=2053492 RepID=UPI002878F069|nr:OsmC family protein [Accumulibacter sp.]MDS4015562.1 OsmC family protein [Accumulibacter sp.]
MNEYSAQLLWLRREQSFLDQRYSRRHVLRFDGGVEVAASSSPHVVPLPMSDPAAIDPEEAFVVSLASCHLLWFLSIAAGRGYCVDSYADHPVGVMARNAEGKLAMTVVTLRPQVAFSGDRQPTPEDVLAMHHAAHEACFIANSVRSEVRCEPRLR